MSAAADLETPLQQDATDIRHDPFFHAPPQDAAPHERSDGPEPRGSSSNGFSTLVMLIIITWQGCMVSKYGMSFPGTILTGEHKPLNSSCTNLFWITDWSLFLSLFMVVLDGVLTTIAVAPRLKERFAGCVSLAKFGEGFTGLMKTWIAIAGIVVILFRVDPKETHECRDLYQCAWWCFVGVLLVPVAMFCCFMAVVGTASTVAQAVDADGAGLIDTGAGAGIGAPLGGHRASYGTGLIAQPQGPRMSEHTVQPFSGKGNKLAGDDEASTAPAPSETAAATASAQGISPEQP